MLNHQNLQLIQQQLASYNAQLVAVTKKQSLETILQLHNAGVRVMGENKVQELLPKYEQLPKDINWHLIGHLQTNKIKQIASFVKCIHSVDSPKLLTEIDKQAKQHNRIIKCLLQVHIATEETKFGFTPDELLLWLKQNPLNNLHHVSIVGLMGMATFTDNKTQIHHEFKQLKQLFDECKKRYFALQDSFCELSMGMSDDYPIALNEGSTMVRIGSLLYEL